MKYILKTTEGDIELNFGNYFLKVLSKNKGIDYSKATVGLFTQYGKLLKNEGGQTVFNTDAELTPFLDELAYIVQAGMQASNAHKGIFDVEPLEKIELLLLDKLGSISESFSKYGEIVVKVAEAINPVDLGKGDKEKKSQAAKRKSPLKKS